MAGEAWRAALDGLLFGAGLIIAIGAQNSYILRQGIRKQYVFITALTSATADGILIVVGVAGLGTFIANNEVLLTLATWGGALFLFYFGLRSLLTAFKPIVIDEAEAAGGAPQTQMAAIAAALGFSLLNPHVYLDTVVLIGALGAGYPQATRLWFAGGATLASFIWFFALAYGAGQLAPLFKKPLTTRILDVSIALILWWIGGNLVIEQVWGRF